jgi:hypothetical protein
MKLTALVGAELNFISCGPVGKRAKRRSPFPRPETLERGWKKRWKGTRMSEKVEALSFKLLVDAPLAAAHSSFSCEGIINTGLEEHLKHCQECRTIIATDLRGFAKQIEELRP